jgi:hypothetical protein
MDNKPENNKLKNKTNKHVWLTYSKRNFLKKLFKYIYIYENEIILYKKKKRKEKPVIIFKNSCKKEERLLLFLLLCGWMKMIFINIRLFRFF